MDFFFIFFFIYNIIIIYIIVNICMFFNKILIIFFQLLVSFIYLLFNSILKARFLNNYIINKQPQVLYLSFRNFGLKNSHTFKIKVLYPFNISCYEKPFLIQLIIREKIETIFIKK